MPIKDAEYFIERVELATKGVLSTNKQLIDHQFLCHGFMESINVMTSRYLEAVSENEDLIRYINTEHREFMPSQVTSYIRAHIQASGKPMEKFCEDNGINYPKLRNQLGLRTSYTNDILKVFGLNLGVYKSKL